MVQIISRIQKSSKNPGQKNVPPGTAGPIFTNPSMNKAVRAWIMFAA